MIVKNYLLHNNDELMELNHVSGMELNHVSGMVMSPEAYTE